MKEAYYFAHDCNARNDTKILAMRSKYGSEGYGWYWMIIEILREQSDYKLKNDKYLSVTLAMQMQCDCNAVALYIAECINEFELFQTDGEYIWSNSLIRRMKSRDIKSEKAKKAAEARWNKTSENGEDTDAMQPQCECNAIKEKKRNKKKRNIYKDIDSIINDYTSNSELIEALKGYVEMRKGIKSPMTDRALKLLLGKLDKLASDDNGKIELLNDAILHNWKSVYLRDNKEEQDTTNYEEEILY